MLEQNIKTQLQEVFKNLKSEYLLKIEVDSKHQSKEELVNLLEDLASCSDKIKVETQDAAGLRVSILKICPMRC